VFPSRVFRHSGVFINKKSGIIRAEDLKGKKVGAPEYSVTAALWIRGFLQHDHGVAPSDIEWYEGGLEERGPKKQRITIQPPENIHINPVPYDRSIDEMLVNCEIDAIISPTAPPSYTQGHPDVDRLWPDYKTVEMDYFRRTKLFPIMHTVVLKKELYEAYPWAALSLYKAFVQAKRLCQKGLTFLGALDCMLPWSVAEYDSTVDLMGEDFWPYGFEENRHILETMTQYSYEQGLSSRKLSIDELFAPSTMVPFKY
jgi:4,5-dihydroxyphthalate decarboxylase